MALNRELLETSFELVVEREPELTRRFYDELFARYPQSQSLFTRRPRGQQERMLAEALGAVIAHLGDEAWLVGELKDLGARHVAYGVTDEMYGWVAESLLAVLASVGGEAWTEPVAQAWTDALTAIAGLMQAGAAEAIAAAQSGAQDLTATVR